MPNSNGDDKLSEVIELAIEYQLAGRPEDVKEDVATITKAEIEEQIFQEKAEEIRKQAYAAAKKDIDDARVKAIKETLMEGVVVGVAIGLLVNELSFLVGLLEDATHNKVLASLVITLVLSIVCFAILLSDFVKRVSKIV